MKESIQSVLDMYKEGSLGCEDAQKLIEALWDGGEEANLPWEQDNKLRIVAFRGRRLIKRMEAGEYRMELKLDGDALDVECWGSIKINGDVEGDINACGDVTCNGDIGGGASAGGDVTCRGSISGAVTTGGDVSAKSIHGAVVGTGYTVYDRSRDEQPCADVDVNVGINGVDSEAIKEQVEPEQADMSETVCLSGEDVEIVAMQNGKRVAETKCRSLHVIWEGDTADVTCGVNITVNGIVEGDVTAGAAVAQTGGYIEGNVTAGAHVTCGNVEGNIEAGGNVMCGNVEGDVEAGTDVTCGDVEGNIEAGSTVRCGNVEGDVEAGINVDCGDVAGDVTAGASVTCGDVEGDIEAGGNVRRK